MAKNCWEVRECGREPGGRRAAQLGICPAALFGDADGYLGGRNGGRACAFVAGTFCEGDLQGTYRDKSKDCWDCAFYQGLKSEHGSAFSLPAFALYLRRRRDGAARDLVAENSTD